MDRANRLINFWRWLPAFRVVGETEHVRKAAGLLHVTPSALSRTIRLLEEDLQVQLFRAEGRSIRLTPDGKKFLVAVRDAMRRVDDGLAAIRSDQLSGPFRLSTVDLFGSQLLAVLPEVQRQHPELQVAVETTEDTFDAELLLRGAVDVAFTTKPLGHNQILSERTTTITFDIFCAATHALADQAGLGLDVVVEHPFVVCGGPVDPTKGGWPVDVPRQTTAIVQSFDAAAQLAAQAGLLAVLPTDSVIAQALQLQPLGVEGLAEATIWSHRRTLLVEGDPASVVLDVIRDAVS